LDKDFLAKPFPCLAKCFFIISFLETRVVDLSLDLKLMEQMMETDDCKNSPCHKQATCFNTIGHYACVCNMGFIGWYKNILQLEGKSRLLLTLIFD